MCKNKFTFFEGLPTYKKALKALLKKFKGQSKLLENEFKVQFIQLCINPFQGDRIPGFDNFWKYRIGIPKLRLSKRNGFRLIYFIDESNKGIVPAHIYFKPEKDDLTDEELNQLTAELDKILTNENDYNT